jgi:uncharacterized protein YndB with AHSA1/START domain
MARSENVRGTSHSFACYAPACPEEAWDALTSASRTPAYLYGLAAHSTWEADAVITAVYEGRTRLTGHVLCARPGERLSYLLQAESADPPTYLTWLIRPSPSGCTITLVVDEPDTRDTTEDAEDTWLPVLAALQRHLASHHPGPLIARADLGLCVVAGAGFALRVSSARAGR